MENKNLKIRKTKDILLNSMTYLFSSFGIVILLAIIIYVFANGLPNLSWDLISSDYTSYTYTLRSETPENINGSLVYEDPNIEGSYFSSKWGISLYDGNDVEGNAAIKVAHIDENSPLNNMIDTTSEKLEYISLTVEDEISIIQVEYYSLDENGATVTNYLNALSRRGAENMINVLNQGEYISSLMLNTHGGGIRGSLISTLYLILFTLLFALPLGIGGAIYLNEYAPKNKFTNILRSFIDMIGGVPSIIFGLLGLTIFVPIVSSITGSNSGTILSGSLTMACMLLPTIIKTTEESLKVIPDSYRNGSLALGASKTQTIFKVIIPNALPGILTSVLLAIGRIIGESAALIFAIGTMIMDSPTPITQGTSLAVHIWVLVGGENPNYGAASAIAIIILLVVFLMNILVKFIGYRFRKKQLGRG